MRRGWPDRCSASGKMVRATAILAICLCLVPGSAGASAGVYRSAAPGRQWKRVPRPLVAVGRALRDVTVKRGMVVGTALVVGGVAAAGGLYHVGADEAAAFAALVPPTLGVKMNTVALGARLHDAYRRAEGGRFRKLGRVL